MSSERDGLKPPPCPQCGCPGTEVLNDGASGYCPKCGAAWANYITLTIEIPKEEDSEAKSTAGR